MAGSHKYRPRVGKNCRLPWIFYFRRSLEVTTEGPLTSADGEMSGKEKEKSGGKNKEGFRLGMLI